MTRFIGVRMAMTLTKPILAEWYKEETREKSFKAFFKGGQEIGPRLKEDTSL